MSEVNFIAQPALRTTLMAIEEMIKASDITRLDVAAAYVTSSGTYDLLKCMNAALGTAWTGVKKRWITSFDYCRTQPIALETLLSLPESLVKVYDAHFCLANGGMPKSPFHPKAILFRGTDKDFALAGSGNLSRSGLSKGVEVGLTIAVDRKNPIEPTSAASIKALRQWYKAVWETATPLDTALLKRYANLFESEANLSHPATTEDDLASGETTKGALTNKDLQKLRVCKHFWIDAGNITKNRGPHLPGNQLMMKRLSRVFFGCDPIAVPENTVIGTVDLSYSSGPATPCTLSYSDNKMDKLNLPVPGTVGPAAYDNQLLLFREVGPHLFKLTIGTKADKARWVEKSNAIGADFRMSSGRAWGVF
jgi:HKD family nuclease